MIKVVSPRVTLFFVVVGFLPASLLASPVLIEPQQDSIVALAPKTDMAAALFADDALFQSRRVSAIDSGQVGSASSTAPAMVPTPSAYSLGMSVLLMMLIGRRGAKWLGLAR